MKASSFHHLRWALVLVAVALTAEIGFGQDKTVASPRALVTSSAPVKTLKTTTMIEKLSSKGTTRRTRVVTIDPAAFTADQVVIQLFDDLTLTADRMDIGFAGTRYRNWTGRTSNGGSAAFIINGRRVSGTLSSADGNFQFLPSGDGECVVVQYHPGGFPDCAVGSVTPPPRATGPESTPTKSSTNGDTHRAGANSNGDGSQGDTPTANRIRVLVAYTADAQSLTSSTLGQTVQELIDLAVLESNQGYANSGVALRIELCCLYETVYNETAAIETDVDRFRNSGDGFMDEVHTFRTDYDADMCCLLVDGTDSEWCGWAYDFNYTSYGNMFQATVFSCATGNYTFAHEFGHTQGCRHNDDNTLTPFAYGHGFRNGSNWRTIMGLANGTSAPRLNYWSNPNINSPVSPFTAMGTPVNGANFANDCRTALNTSDNTVVNHELTPVISSALDGDIFAADEGADKVVTGTLTVGSFAANSGSRVQFRAGTSIVLTTGFRAAPGSSFRARLASPLGDPAGGAITSSTDNDQPSRQETAVAK